MTLDELKNAIGADRYEFACKDAWQRAVTTGTQELEADFGSIVPFELRDKVLATPVFPADKLTLLLDLYEEMPSHALLSPLRDLLPQLTEEQQQQVWDKFRHYLGHEDEALSVPAEYALWCDFFSDPLIAGLAWINLVMPPVSDRQIVRLLTTAGPLPWDLKAALYQQLVPDRTWHYAIYRSILYSRFDPHGKIQPKDALKLLQLLEIPEEAEHLEELRETLKKDLRWRWKRKSA